jgi:hypothetical protein
LRLQADAVLLPATTNGVWNAEHDVWAGQPVLADGAHSFSHRLLEPIVTHDRPATHGTLAEQAWPCVAAPTTRQLTTSCIVFM